MPRKKLNVPVIITSGAKATSASRLRRVLVNLRNETGDPWQDGEVWLSRIAMTRKARIERDNGEAQWRQYYRWYKGKQWNDRGSQGGTPNSDNPRDTATVNKTGSIITSIVPFIVNDEIKFLLDAAKPTEDEGRGVRIQQSLLNYEWRTQKVTQRAIKSCALDFATIGHCVAKTGYTVEVDESRKPNEDGVINYADYIREDAPYVERVNPLNFLFDLGARDHTLHTARWCAEVMFVPFADVLANKQYDKETLGMLRSGDSSVSTKAAWEMMGTDPRSIKTMQGITLPEDNLVALILIFDKKYQNMMIYPDGCPRPLLAEDWPYPYLRNFPYMMANFIDVPNEPYGLGVPAWIEDQQNQLNRANTLEQDVMRKSRPRTAASENTNPEEVQKFKDGDDIVVGEFKVLQAADLSQMFQVYKQNLERVIEQMTGADAVLQGERLPSRTTAGEIGTRARLTGLKLDQHVEDFEEFVEGLGEQVLAHLKKFRTTGDVIKVVGPDGADWIPYSNEDIQDDVEVDVEYFAAPKTDLELEKAQRKDILQLAVSAMPVMAERTDQIPDIPALLAWVVDAYGEKDAGRFFRPLRVAGGPSTNGAGPGAGLPPALAGALAPAPSAQTPGVGAPSEGMSVQDLMQSIRGGLQ